MVATNDSIMDSALSPPHHNPVHGSPAGSSVFDLPIQNANISGPSKIERRSTVTRHNQNQTRLDIGPGREINTDQQANSTDHITENPPRSPPTFVVVSGGTGGNAICSAFGPDACYVLPVSDDGGSSSEIIRVLGGPSIGDIRSRLVRLIPAAPPASPLDSIRALLAYRLPADCSEREAHDQWRDIVEGKSPLWSSIPSDRKEAIRGFFVWFENELLKRAHKNFSFLNGSIGNYFLAAARGFFRSLPSAIFLFSSITNSQANILPAIVTNHIVTIAAELENGEKLVGQCEISHPVPPPVDVVVSQPQPWSPLDGDGMGEIIAQRQNLAFEPQAKDHYQPLPSRICRMYYINAYGHEIHPAPNPDYITSLSSNDVLVYSCGSLWTSIMPCLALRGVSTAIARSRSLRAKVLLLNSKNDRETHGYTAVDYINAIVGTLNAQYHTQPYGLGNVNTTYPISAFITDLVYLKNTLVPVDVQRITALGVRCTEVELEGGLQSNHNHNDGHGADSDAQAPRFDSLCVRRAIDGILARSRSD